MQKTCCFDFGNTRLKCALFQDRELLEMVVLENGHPDTVQTLINSFQPDKSILASVINHDPEVETVLAASTLFHKLGHTSKIPFSTPVGKPETIGADRLAAVAAAVDLFPKQHNLVIGLGTCITYNYVNPTTRIPRRQHFSWHANALPFHARIHGFIALGGGRKQLSINWL
jgi:type III pantothenate kinase